MPVTGNNINKYKRTSILTYWGGFSFYDANTNTSTEYSVENKGDYLIRAASFIDKINEEGKKTDRIIYNTDMFAVIPVELYDSSHCSDYLKSKDIELSLSHIVVVCRYKDMIFLIAVDSIFYNSVISVNNDIKIVHPLLLTIMASDIVNSESEYNILLNKVEDYVHIVAYSSEKILFCDTIKTESYNDIVFCLTTLSNIYYNSNITVIGDEYKILEDIISDSFKNIKYITLDQYHSL